MAHTATSHSAPRAVEVNLGTNATAFYPHKRRGAEQVAEVVTDLTATLSAKNGWDYLGQFETCQCGLDADIRSHWLGAADGRVGCQQVQTCRRRGKIVGLRDLAPLGPLVDTPIR
jgi:hypothetical protein